MKGRQKQVVQAFQRVQDLLTVHPPPTTAAYTVQKQVLDDAIAKLTEHGTDQGAARRLSKAATKRQEALRAKLREQHLAPIAKIARAMLRDVSGIDVALTMPSWNLKTHNLVAAALAFRKVAEQYEAVFIESGRPQDFLAQLDAAIAALGQSGLGQSRNLGTHVGAREGIDQQLKRGRQAVELIDAMMRSAYGDQPVVLGMWRVARRIRGIAGGVGGAPEIVPTAEARPTAA